MVASWPAMAPGMLMFQDLVLAPKEESRVPNQFRPDRIKFSSCRSSTPKAKWAIRVSSIAPAYGSNVVMEASGSESSASMRRYHLAVSPQKGAWWDHPSDASHSQRSWARAYQHTSSPGSKLPSSNPRKTTRCCGMSNGRSASFSKGNTPPPCPNKRSELGVKSSGCNPTSKSWSYPMQCTPSSVVANATQVPDDLALEVGQSLTTRDDGAGEAPNVASRATKRSHPASDFLNAPPSPTKRAWPFAC